MVLKEEMKLQASEKVADDDVLKLKAMEDNANDWMIV